MYTIFYIHFGYEPGVEFHSEEEAKQYGINKGFSFAVYFNNTMIASWDPINGYDSMRRELGLDDAKLQKLIGEFEAAVRSKNRDEQNRLCMLIETEADRIGYTNHTRLRDLYSWAEREG